jgi:hypothetical protein
MAKRIVHKGHLIIKRDNSYLCDPEIKGVQYSVYAKGKTDADSSAVEITNSLRQAKWFVDRMVEAGGDDWTLADDFGV